MAGEGAAHAAQLDRALHRRRRAVRNRGPREPVTVFTTRPDTLFGATFFVVAADSDLAAELASGRAAEAEFAELPRLADEARADIDRMASDRPKTGVFLDRYAINPVNGERLPIWPATTCWPTTAPARSWPSPRTTSATSTLRARSTCRSGSSSQSDTDPAGHRRRRPPTTVRTCNSGPLDGLDRTRRSRGSSSGSTSRPQGEAAVQLPAARLADQPPALSGARRSRSSTARRAARCRSPRTSCPSSCPTPRAWTCKPKGTSPLGALRRVVGRRLPALRWPGAA